MTERDRPLGGEVEALRSEFLERIDELRPQLHRYCSRMVGSLLDGEDVVQDTLIHAFYRLPTLKNQDALKSWLFRIAHNRCIDLIRTRKPESLGELDVEESFEPVDLAEERQSVGFALEAIVGGLPPKERASVLLKDVLDYSLAEIAEIVGSTIGGVKAALHRGRGRLQQLRAPGLVPGPRLADKELLQTYVDTFNARDWDKLRGLIRADARLEIVGMGEGRMGDNYSGNYVKFSWQWELALCMVDGEPMVVHYRLEEGTWQPRTAIRITFADGLVTLVRDYAHIDYVLAPHYSVQRIARL